MATRLALRGELSYNYRMTQARRPSFWLWLMLTAVLVAVIAVWTCYAAPGGRGRSPLPTPADQMTSPLPTPISAGTDVAPSLPWISGGAALLWVVLGVLLGLGIALVVFRSHRRDT